MDLGEIALEGRLAGGGVGAGVIVIADPFRQELVEGFERELFREQGDELLSDGEEKALDLAAPLGDVGP